MFLKQRFSGRSFWIMSGTCLVLGIAVVSVLAKNSDRDHDTRRERNPPISWSPTTITQTISAGSSATTTVSLKASEMLTDVCLKVSRPLRALVDVSPAIFPTIAKGQVVQVTITAYAPSTFPMKILEGAIYARAKANFDERCDRNDDDDFSRAIDLRLPVVLKVVWAKFTDPQTGIQLSYPDLGVPSKVDASTSSSGATRLDVSFQSTDSPDFINGFGIFIYQNPNGLSLQNWFHQQIDPNGNLISGAAFTETELSNKMSVLVISGPLPSDFGPVMSAYSISKSGKTIIAIGQSEDNQLGALGLTQSQIDQVLLQVLVNLQSP